MIVMRITVTVDGRPPRKNGAQSLWNSPESGRVLELRLGIRREQDRMENRDLFDDPVRVELEVFAPNVLDRGNSQTYVGDIDTFVAGICETIQKADGNVKQVSDVFDGHDDVRPELPMLIMDDAQVAEISAKKTKDGDERYILTVEDGRD